MNDYQFNYPSSLESLLIYTDTDSDGNVQRGKMFPVFPNYFNGYVKETTLFEKPFFDSGRYKEYFFQLLLGMILSVPMRPDLSAFGLKDLFHRKLDEHNLRFVVLQTDGDGDLEVNMHSVFFGRLAPTPKNWKYTSEIANENHYVTNYDSLVRSMTAEEYETLKGLLQTHHYENMDKIRLCYYEYAVVPEEIVNVHSSVQVMTVKMNYMEKYTDVGVEDQERINFVEGLRNEPMHNIKSTSEFWRSGPLNFRLSDTYRSHWEWLINWRNK